MKNLCIINLRANFKNDQNFYTFLHTLDYFEDMRNFFNYRDIISSECRKIDGEDVIFITIFRYEQKEIYDLFCFHKDSWVSIKDLGEVFMHRIREVFAEEFI